MIKKLGLRINNSQIWLENLFTPFLPSLVLNKKYTWMKKNLILK